MLLGQRSASASKALSQRWFPSSRGRRDRRQRCSPVNSEHQRTACPTLVRLGGTRPAGTGCPSSHREEEHGLLSPPHKRPGQRLTRGGDEPAVGVAQWEAVVRRWCFRLCTEAPEVLHAHLNLQKLSSSPPKGLGHPPTLHPDRLRLGGGIQTPAEDRAAQVIKFDHDFGCHDLTSLIITILTFKMLLSR